DTDTRRINELVAERHSKIMRALGGALETEDDLGKVVRAHIHIESELQLIIFFAAPNPNHLKSFDRQEFSEKVQLALLLGLRPDLASPLNAAGKLRNKFAHRLDTRLNEEISKNLLATLPPQLKDRPQTTRSIAFASPDFKTKIEARLGRPLPQLTEAAHPFDILEGE